MKEKNTILVVDIGNTNMVIGGYIEENLVFSDRLNTNTEEIYENLAEQLDEILQRNQVEKDTIEGCIISSVVPNATPNVKIYMRNLIEKEPLVMGENVENGIEVRRENPSKVGTDLIATAVAGKEKYGCPVVIFDLGTATTATVVNKDGAYIGGIIAPGIKISQDALSAKAALLPEIELKAPERCINGGTIGAMQSGVVLGTASMIDGMIDRIQNELNAPAKMLLTGGLSEVVKEHILHEIVYEPNLLLEGLYIIYRKNG